MANEFLKSHFDTEGPFGIPMKDAQAKMLEGVIKSLPEEDRQVCRLVTAKAPTELLDGERADVSWISTQAIDRDNEIMVAKGMNDSHFKLNPIVTLNHEYYLPPVGKSVSRKRVKDGDMVGIKAKTQYPEKPKDWPDKEWEPDCIFGMVKAGIMSGKSVGFIRLKSHSPTPDEIKKNPELVDCFRIIEEWMLLEYACCWLPVNQEAIVEQVSKSAVKLPRTICDLLQIAPASVESEPPQLAVSSFMSEAEIHRCVERQLRGIDFETLARKAVRESIDHFCGKV